MYAENKTDFGVTSLPWSPVSLIRATMSRAPSGGGGQRLRGHYVPHSSELPGAQAMDEDGGGDEPRSPSYSTETKVRAGPAAGPAGAAVPGPVAPAPARGPGRSKELVKALCAEASVIYSQLLDAWHRANDDLSLPAANPRRFAVPSAAQLAQLELQALTSARTSLTLQQPKAVASAASAVLDVPDFSSLIAGFAGHDESAIPEAFMRHIQTEMPAQAEFVRVLHRVAVGLPLSPEQRAYLSRIYGGARFAFSGRNAATTLLEMAPTPLLERMVRLYIGPQWGPTVQELRTKPDYAPPSRFVLSDDGLTELPVPDAVLSNAAMITLWNDIAGVFPPSDRAVGRTKLHEHQLRLARVQLEFLRLWGKGWTHEDFAWMTADIGVLLERNAAYFLSQASTHAPFRDVNACPPAIAYDSPDMDFMPPSPFQLVMATLNERRVMEAKLPAESPEDAEAWEELRVTSANYSRVLAVLAADGGEFDAQVRAQLLVKRRIRHVILDGIEDGEDV